MNNRLKKISSILSLFASTSTLFCCALPALFVAIGAGAVFASITSAIPQLIWISKYKGELFLFAGSLLVISWYLSNKTKAIQCDVKHAEVCTSTKDFSHIVWVISVVIYLVGVLFAYILPLVMNR